MLFDETTEPLQMSAQEIREFVANTQARIKQALYELKKEESYGVLNAEIVVIE